MEIHRLTFAAPQVTGFNLPSRFLIEGKVEGKEDDCVMP